MTKEDWKEIHPGFNSILKKEWEKRGLTSEDAEAWIRVGFEPWQVTDIERYVTKLEEQGLTRWEANQWVKVCLVSNDQKSILGRGPTENDYEFARYLKKDGYQPSDLNQNNLEELRKKASWQDIHEGFSFSKRKEWEEQGFDHWQTKEWINVGLKPNEVELSSHLRQNNHVPQTAFQEKSHAQVWLDSWYPLEGTCIRKGHEENFAKSRKRITKIDVKNENLKGSLNLEGFINLKELDCSVNQLTNLDLSDCNSLKSLSLSNNQLSNLNFLQSLKNPEKLTRVDISGNNLASSLTSLQGFVGLEVLDLHNNHFSGSLKPLSGMVKLQSLNINDTDLDSGLEHLAESVCIYCSVDERKNAKCQILTSLLKNVIIDKTFSQSWKIQTYKEKNEWKDTSSLWNHATNSPTKKWIDIDLKLNDTDYAIWLRDKINLTTEQVLEHKNNKVLREQYIEYLEGWKDSKQAQEWLDWNYPEKQRQDIEELDLSDQKLEGDLDLERFDSLRKIYITGNPQLGKIKNKPLYARVYANAQEQLNKIYPNRDQAEVIDLGRLEDLHFDQLSELVIDNYPNLKKIKGEDVRNITKTTISNCPQLEEIEISEFGGNKELILNSLPNLKKLDCSNNKLTTLDLRNYSNLKWVDCQGNFLTEIKLPIQGEKLERLDISDNNFPEQDLSFLSHLTNLKELNLGNGGNHYDKKGKGEIKRKVHEGIYNRFTGSLEPLKNLVKLECLNISNTNIDSGLEYLPKSVFKFYCLVFDIYNELHKEWKVKKIEQELGGSTDEDENSANLLRIWRENRKGEQLEEKIKELREKVQFEERGDEIEYLEARVQELIKSVKNQKWKIINAFSRLLPEKELLQELIKTNLELTRFKEQEMNSPNYDERCDECTEKCQKIKRQLRDKLAKETMNEIQSILTDCENLVRDEVELETRLNDKSLLIEGQKRSLQITDGSEENKTQVRQHEEIQKNQDEQFRRERSKSLLIVRQEEKLEAYREEIDHWRKKSFMPTNQINIEGNVDELQNIENQGLINRGNNNNLPGASVSGNTIRKTTEEFYQFQAEEEIIESSQQIQSSQTQPSQLSQNTMIVEQQELVNKGKQKEDLLGQIEVEEIELKKLVGSVWGKLRSKSVFPARAKARDEERRLLLDDAPFDAQKKKELLGLGKLTEKEVEKICQIQMKLEELRKQQQSFQAQVLQPTNFSYGIPGASK